MKAATKIIINVIRRRMDAGEAFDAILLDYPRLVGAELAEVRQALGIK